MQIKAQVPDAFLFFRLGDFYELFFDDAVLAARELEITLTGRGHSDGERIPMCGVPYHSADQYIARLVAKGYKVAICEQVEDPKTAKGVVKREIVRIVTPGTVMEQRSLDDKSNNYIAAVVRSKDTYALAACDLTTGELYFTRVSGSFDRLLDELMVFTPSEIVVFPEDEKHIRSRLAYYRKTVTVTPRSQETVETDGIPIAHEIQKLSPPGATCLKLLLSYLKETQKRWLSHITRIRTYEPRQYMTLDPFTRKSLELKETVMDGGKEGTLLWLLDRTVTAMGGRLLRRFVDRPLLDLEAIERRLEAVGALKDQLIVREEIISKLKNVYDLERLVGRIAYGSANARDLIALKTSLKEIPALIAICKEAGSSTLSRLVDSIDPCADIAEQIERAIADDPPVSVREGGIIRSGYDERLDKLRTASKEGKRWIAELEQREREATGIKSLKVGFNKVFGYYIEVTRANLSALPPGRYERKQTLANAERFVTPELKEKEALILEAEEKMADIEYELFVELRNWLAEQTGRLQKLAEVVAEIDVYQSFARVSDEYGYTRPNLHDGYDMHVKNGRHPVVEAMLKEETFIRNDVHFEQDRARTLLITGPNMAGKSTYMRQVALISIMAQIGCFVPADEASIPLVDRIFTRIGAADDLAGGSSTFMMEMKDIRVMTDEATPKSLVIIDELGRGTSTGEGMAIAQAVIEYIHNHIGCKTLVSTHFHELARLEDELSYLQNYSMAVKENEGEVVFLRKLVRGAADTSYGIYCARLAGVRDSIIERAYSLLNEFAKSRPEPDAAPGAFVREIAATSATNATHESPEEAGDDDSSVLSEAVQLSLFPEEEKQEVSASKYTALEQKALKALKQADVMNMTPLEALTFINEWKQKLIRG